MFKKKPKSPEQIALEKEIASVHASMAGFDTESDEFAQCMEHLDRLHKLLDAYRPEKINPNSVITAAGSLAGIVLIVSYERAHVFTSAAKNFVIKAR